MTRFPEHPDDPDAEATPEELAAAEELRLALADASRENEEAALLRAAALAHAPRSIDDADHRAIVDAALAKMPTTRKRSTRGMVVRVVFGAAASAVALAAGIALFVRLGEPPESAHLATHLVRVRSTQPLFAEPFAQQGGTTARIDRIALARQDDLRQNRFSRWGVR